MSQAHPPELIALDRAIKAAGSIASLAQKIGVATSSPAMWKSRGGRVPSDHCAAIELLTGVKRWDLRPDDWHRIWPELIGAEGAPATPEPTTTQGA
jgi:DNA-binding transcriptional regulator YdaS (Cro superfamily)